MSLLAAVRVVLHDKTCFIASLYPSMYVETPQCCNLSCLSLLIICCRLKKSQALIFLGKFYCHVCLGMSAVTTVWVFSVCVCTFLFEYLCKFRFRHLVQHAATVWDSDSYCLLITQAATLLVFAIGCFGTFDHAACKQLPLKSAFMITIAEASCKLPVSYAHSHTWLYTVLSPLCLSSYTQQCSLISNVAFTTNHYDICGGMRHETKPLQSCNCFW